MVYGWSIEDSGLVEARAPRLRAVLPDTLLTEDFETFELLNFDDYWKDDNNDEIEYSVYSLNSIVDPFVMNSNLDLRSIPNKYGVDTLIILAKDSLFTVKDTIVVSVTPEWSVRMLLPDRFSR